MARFHATYAKTLASRVQSYGLTIPQFGTLEAPYHLGPLSLGELADKLLVTGGNVTYVTVARIRVWFTATVARTTAV